MGAQGPVVWMTGGRGFIGRRVVQSLTGRASVVPVTIDPSAAGAAEGRHFLDLGDPGSIARLSDKVGAPAAFLHLGWGGMTTPDDEAIHLGTNVEDGKKLIGRLYDAGLERFVLVGSIDEYGEQTGALTEDMPDTGRLTKYAQGKRVLCAFGLEEAEKRDRSFIHVRLSNTYGPGQRAGALLNKLFAMRDDTDVVDLGPCDNFRDYVFVDDAAEGLARLAGAEGRTVVNLGGGAPIVLRDFVIAFWKHLGADPDRLNFGAMTRRPDEPEQPQRWVDLGHLKEIIGWAPSTTLDAGMAHTIKEMKVAQ